MPLYEYECQACGQRTEEVQKYSDPPLQECASCSGELEKLISSPAIQFKGSGWYITDYARKGSTGSDAKSSPKTSSGEGSSSKSSSTETRVSSET